MIKRIWTFKRIILAIIIFMCTIIVAISLQKSIMGTDKLQRDFGVALLFIVVLVCLLYFLYNNSDYLQKARKYGHFTGYKN